MRRSNRFFCKASLAAAFMPYTPVPTNPVVFFDVSRTKEHLGRVTIELFADVVPRSAENFRSLCTGERGSLVNVPLPVNPACRLYYKGVPFHRIIPGFVVQGGDILHMDGRGNESIFGYPFLDESFEGKAGDHRSGTVAMASTGPNQNGSQFFINMTDSPQLNGKYVVVGQVIDGWNVVQAIQRLGSRCGTPLEKVWCTECGQAGVDAGPAEALDGGAHHHMEGKEVLSMLRPRQPGNLHPYHHHQS